MFSVTLKIDDEIMDAPSLMELIIGEKGEVAKYSFNNNLKPDQSLIADLDQKLLICNNLLFNV